MTPTFEKITIPYLDYLNKKVCASEYVDYETNTLKPNERGMVEVKYRMKRKMVPVEEVELVDLHPDYRLSEEVRRIPFKLWRLRHYYLRKSFKLLETSINSNQQYKLYSTTAVNRNNTVYKLIMHEFYRFSQNGCLDSNSSKKIERI